VTRRRGALALLVAAAACSSGGAPTPPTGTPSDPVETCVRLADVCRLDAARLGVCSPAAPGAAPASCAGRTPCLVCVPQH
jgi:hypothetical protein